MVCEWDNENFLSYRLSSTQLRKTLFYDSVRKKKINLNYHPILPENNLNYSSSPQGLEIFKQHWRWRKCQGDYASMGPYLGIQAPMVIFIKVTNDSNSRVGDDIRGRGIPVSWWLHSSWTSRFQFEEARDCLKNNRVPRLKVLADLPKDQNLLHVTQL